MVSPLDLLPLDQCPRFAEPAADESLPPGPRQTVVPPPPSPPQDSRPAPQPAEPKESPETPGAAARS